VTLTHGVSIHSDVLCPSIGARKLQRLELNGDDVFDFDNTAPSSTHRLKSMIVGTFREMPGLCVNVSQAVRLFGVAPSTCRALLDDLVRSGELCVARDGLYRLDSEHRF
jgi:hypothetical protein